MNSPIAFFPTEPGYSLAFVELTSLLPDYQATLNEARTAAGWDQQKLHQIVAHDYDFLGPFVSARIETVIQKTGQTTEYLVVEFRPPQGRDVAKAERLFQRTTHRAEQVFDIGQLQLRFSATKPGGPAVNVRFDPWTARFSGSGFEFTWSELMFKPKDCIVKVFSS